MFALRWRTCEHASIDSEKDGTEEWKPEGWDCREKGLLITLTGAWGMIIQEDISKHWILNGLFIFILK